MLQSESLYFKYKKSKLHCIKMGQGDEVLIVFHGYGERANHFKILAKKIEHKYTVYSFDLPMHGETWWKGKKIDRLVFKTITEQILKFEGKDKCSLLGVSFGARIALSILEMMSEQVSKIYLVAPDGILSSGWYKAIHRVPNSFKRLVFKFLANGSTVRLAKKWHKKGWLNHHNYRFIEVHLSNYKKRRRLLVYWLSLPSLQPDWRQVKNKLIDYSIPLKVFLATRDEVIPSAAGRIISDDVEQAEIIFMNSNHQQAFRTFLRKAEQFF